MRQKKKPVCTYQARPRKALQSEQCRLKRLEGQPMQSIVDKRFSVPLRRVEYCRNLQGDDFVF